MLPVPDPQIDRILGELLMQNSKGELSFIGFVSVCHDGSSRRVMTGDANSLLLMGSFEYLKGAVLDEELKRENSTPNSLLGQRCAS